MSRRRRDRHPTGNGHWIGADGLFTHVPAKIVTPESAAISDIEGDVVPLGTVECRGILRAGRDERLNGAVRLLRRALRRRRDVGRQRGGGRGDGRGGSRRAGGEHMLTIVMTPIENEAAATRWKTTRPRRSRRRRNHGQAATGAAVSAASSAVDAAVR